jgi:dTDP-4-dehydrorhamnose 3,5-epimerase-like enzyme
VDLRPAGGPVAVEVELGALAGAVRISPLTPLGDERGQLLEPVDDAEIRAGRVLHLHVVECLPGRVRGNHVHRRGRETFCLVSGDFRVWLRRLAGGEEADFCVPHGSPLRIEVDPGIAHAFENIGRRPASIVAWRDHPFDDGDFERCPLLD